MPPASTASPAPPQEMLLKCHLKTPRLPTMLAEYSKLAREAAQADEDYAQYLLRLTEIEVAPRQSNALAARIKAAGFPVLKDLDTYDFSASSPLKNTHFSKLSSPG
jgi:DNA replication protein DnaC